MKRFLQAAGVDYLQWKILVRTFLKMDFAVLRGVRGSASAKRWFVLLITALIYGLAGVAPMVIILTSRDALLGATLMTTTVGFMVLSSLLVGEGLSILSPDDHAILGFRPVDSRTYLAVRVTTLFVRTLVIASLVGYLPVMAFLFKAGFHPGVALGALAAVYGTGAAVTLALVATYGWLLRTVGPARLFRLMSYAQLAINFVVWMGFMAVTQGLQRRWLTGVSLGGNMWVLLYPGAWFGSYVELARGEWDALSVLGATLSGALLLVLIRGLGGKLSLDYADALGRLTTTATAQAPAPRAAWFAFLRNETRAVAILVRSQFKNDLKFRLGIISLLPVTLVYLYIGLQGEAPGDPFVPSSRRGNETGFIQLALMFLPMTLRQAIVTSDAYRASWLFYATPANRARLVLAARDIITLFFLVPYLLFLAAIFAYFFGNVLHALVHAFFLGFMSYLVLQFGIMVDPKLPFSVPIQKDTRAGLTFGLQIGVMIVGMAAYFLLTYVAYRTLARLLVTLAIFVAAAWTMARITRTRIETQAEGFAYLE